METLLLYVLKSCALLALFYLAYQLLLKKETFFNANRVFLLMGLITATLLPMAVFTKTVWVAPRPVQQLSSVDMAMFIAAAKNQPPQDEFQVNWPYMLLAIYAAGLLFFGIKLLADIYKVRAMVKGKNLIRQERYKLVDSHDVAAPFSFFNYIVYNSNALQPQELESIISHEKVHSRQKHSVDMLAAQAYCILFWFNPVAWLYRKSISQNLEFIADAEATIQVTDRTAYQKTMLRLSVQPQQIAIINHFYQSLIKKRIVMLNKQRSHRRNSWKFAVVLPLLGAFMMAFQVKTVAREKPGTKAVATAAYNDVLMLEITKDADEATLKKHQDYLKGIGAEASFTNVVRNAKGEITGISIKVAANGIERLYDVDGTELITTITISVEKEGDVIKNINVSPAKAAKSTYVTSTDDSSEVAPNGDTLIVRTHKIITNSSAVPVPPAPPAVIANVSFNGSGQNVAMNISDNTLILVNGVKQQKGAPLYIPQGQQISSVNVIKGKDAKKKYGKEAKDGAIEITTARAQNGHAMVMAPNRAFAFNYDVDVPVIADSDFSLSTDEMPDLDFELNIDDIDSDTHMLILKNKMAALNSEDGRAAMYERINKVKEEVQKAREKRYLVIKDRERSAADRQHAASDRATEKNYRLDFISEKIKMELYKDMQEMEKAREQMEKVLKEMDAERAKYKAEKTKATRKA